MRINGCFVFFIRTYSHLWTTSIDTFSRFDINHAWDGRTDGIVVAYAGCSIHAVTRNDVNHVYSNFFHISHFTARQCGNANSVRSSVCHMRDLYLPSTVWWPIVLVFHHQGSFRKSDPSFEVSGLNGAIRGLINSNMASDGHLWNTKMGITSKLVC